jgi:hypothetical protein
VAAVLRDPSIIAAKLRKQREEGPDPALLADREAVRRQLGKIEKQQERLIRHFREADDEGLPWDLVKRELAQAEQEKGQLQATLADLDRRLAKQRMAVEQLDALAVYCARVVRNLERFDFDGKRLALEALDIRVVANGRDWQLDGGIPSDEAAGIVSQTSKHYGFRLPPLLGRV